MRYLTNADVADLISHPGSGDAVHWFGMMAGSSRALDLAVVRIKSDVVSWAPSGRENKFAGRSGLFAGIVLAFRISDGAPAAIATGCTSFLTAWRSRRAWGMKT